MTMPLTQLQPDLAELVTGTRAAVATRAGWQFTARLVADQLRRHLPGPNVLTAEQRLGDPGRARSHPLHVEPDGSFSIVALVWRTGQLTRIHDHITWCVYGVLQGMEHEELFDEHLNLLGENDNHPGEVSGSRHPATSTESATPAPTPPSPCTSTAPTSPASAPASATTTTDVRLTCALPLRVSSEWRISHQSPRRCGCIGVRHHASTWRAGVGPTSQLASSIFPIPPSMASTS